MPKSLVEILSAENCLNCSKNCKGFCSAIHRQLDPDKIAHEMECVSQGNKQFVRILSDYVLDYIREVLTYEEP